MWKGRARLIIALQLLHLTCGGRTVQVRQAARHADAGPADRRAPAVEAGIDGAPAAEDLGRACQLIDPLWVAPDHCAIGHFALTGRSAVALRDDRVWTVADAREPGENPLLRWSIDWDAGQLVDREVVFSVRVPPAASNYLTNLELAVSGDGAVATAYLSGQHNEQGAVYWGAAGRPPEIYLPAPANAGLLFWDQQTLLVAARGLGEAEDGSGIYLVREGVAPRRLLGHDGLYTGDLVLTPDALLLTATDDQATHVLALSRAEVGRAIARGTTLLSFDADLIKRAVGQWTTFELGTMGSELVMITSAPLEGSWPTLELERQALVVEQESVSRRGTPTVIARTRNGAGVVSLTGDETRLAVQLVDRWERHQVAVLAPR